MSAIFERKIMTRDALAQLRASLPGPVVFTNGVFDILHRGHVTYLADAKALGASLIVGVNSDASVRMLGKGDDRPINNEADRMALLAALESVDWVVCFEEQTPVALIEALRPDVLVKARAPFQDAPITMPIDASSSSAWMIAYFASPVSLSTRRRAQCRVNASARKITSGCSRLISPMVHSQKANDFVWGLSTRKIFTPCPIQKSITLFNSRHRLCQSSLSKLKG